MASWSNAASQIANAMELDMSPTTTASAANPLQDIVFHASADIRVDSIERSAHIEGGASSQGPVEHQPSAAPEDAIDRERAAEMQMWWDEAISKNMNLPDGYQKVAVLIVKWAEELDELNTGPEARELATLFSDTFHYHTETVELNVSSKPQLQLNSYLTSFVEKHDGRNSLLIVYYTGHGFYREDQKPPYLELSGSIDPFVKKGFNRDARANWNKAEDILRSDDLEGDVLTILDTCYASNLNLVKSGKEDTRTFELLSACQFDITTAVPGDQSFTRALIDALKELANEFVDKSFTTFHLNQRINLSPTRRDTPSQLWFRLKHHERHIRIAPLKPEKDRERKPSLLHPPRGYLTLRFALRDDSLNREQIEYLTRNLSKAFNNKALVGLRRIDWLGIKPARSTHFGRAALAMFAVAQWKRFLFRKRAERQTQKQVDDVTLPLEPSINANGPSRSSPTRKRTRDVNVFEPNATKKMLVIPSHDDNPPSPPVSIEST